ncbi:MAG: tRNA lysidine(34) synthetase TilS [Oscillospiraceae bacterium]
MTIDAIAPGARVLCAVSGGVDSMYLLYRMAELGAQRGFAVGCAHFNHGLRGAESDRDEAFVRAQCEKLGVPFYAGRGDVASVRGMGTEAAARELRYAFLTRCADEHGYDWIATAHTADDNAETLLLNLARGCGLRGLTGIPPQRGKLLRPMLDTTRAQAEAYLTARAIPHVEDSTNAADTMPATACGTMPCRRSRA